MTQTRRDFLRMSAGALGAYPALSLAAAVENAGPLAPQPTHHAARAKQLIIIFLTGGFSHVDTFNYRPQLGTDAGRELDTNQLRSVAKAKLMPSPFAFRQHGQSGIWVSELFPQLATVIDNLCVINSMRTDIVEHFQAALAMHTGSSTIPLPSIGAWLSYGLGTFNSNLPSYIVFAEHLPYGGAQVWDCNFLPPVHQGVRMIPGREPIPYLHPATQDVTLRELEQRMLDDVNRLHADARPADLNLRARINSFQTARGMMRVAPEVFDLTKETDHTLQQYGVDRANNRSFGWQCLVTRRLIEQGVRIVELIDSGASDNWDAHGNMRDHLPKAARVDQPLTALIRDLKQRGLLDETLVAICTEFGRTPTTFNGLGREHYVDVFTSLLVGGGIRGGVVHGETDEYGMHTTRNEVHVHDYHATILHQLGIDHERLTYRYAGRDFRLTDVHGKVVREILA